MRLHNLKDAAGLMPSWMLSAVLNVCFLALYAVSYENYLLKPSDTIAAVTNTSIVLSLFLAIFIVITTVLKAEAGEIGNAISTGLNRGLSMSWATAATASLAYIGWVPASEFVTGNMTAVTIGGGALAVVVVGYFIAVPSKPSVPDNQHNGVGAGMSLMSPANLQQTNAQRPAFQATLADLTRLLTHQAGRAIGYTGSNILFDDSFSLELDVNARVARVYSNSSVINTSDFMYWRLHMLLMGPAAEKVILGHSSEVAVDDFTNFDDLASRYLTLRNDRTFNAKPMSQHEAALKASRIALLRKTIFDRCLAECQSNRKVLLDLIKLMRTRSVLTYGDIRSYLDRVTMAEGFPVAKFDESDILTKALLEYQHHEEVTLEGAFSNVPHNESAPSDQHVESNTEDDDSALARSTNSVFNRHPANERSFMNA